MNLFDEGLNGFSLRFDFEQAPFANFISTGRQITASTGIRPAAGCPESFSILIVVIILLQNNGGLTDMIRKIQSGGYRLYSRKKDSRTGKRKNLGTFKSLEAARKHERAVQYFKRH